MKIKFLCFYIFKLKGMTLKSNINKGWFTLIEVIIVIAIIISLIWWYQYLGPKQITKNLEKNLIVDFMSQTLNEVRNYSFSNTTLWIDVLKSDSTWNLVTNEKVSRYTNNRKVVWGATSSTSDLAYSHGVYFTTSANDDINIDTWFPYANNRLYLIQYRQPGYSNFQERTIQSFTPSYNDANLVIRPNDDIWAKWSKEYRIPTTVWYYLNKIVSPTDSCKDGPNAIQSFYAVFTSWSWWIVFYNGQTNRELPNFDYKLCFWEDPIEYDERWGISTRLNHYNFTESFIDKLSN